MSAYNRAQGLEEHIRALPHNRHLAYAHNGPTTSRTIVLFFAGLFSIGTAADVPIPCQELNAHWIGITLPGLGKSSAREAGEEYHTALCRDVSALLAFLHPPGNDIETLFLGGGSYGSVMAQMLYGASYEVFPLGRKIRGCLLLAPFPPLRCYPEYARSMSWGTWIAIGPVSQWVPFRALQRLFKAVLGSQLSNESGAKKFLRRTILDKADEVERTRLNNWAIAKGMDGPEELLTSMAKGVVRCCENWTGFLEVSDVINGDWGFEPTGLDGEHASKPILVVVSEQDDIGSVGGNWLEDKYTSARLRRIPGGHISSLSFMDELFAELFEMAGYKG